MVKRIDLVNYCICIERLTVIGDTNAKSVAFCSRIAAPIASINGNTPENGHTSVIYAKKPLSQHPVTRNTWWYTTTSNLMPVLFVMGDSQLHITWKSIWIAILEKNHTNASDVRHVLVNLSRWILIWSDSIRKMPLNEAWILVSWKSAIQCFHNEMYPNKMTLCSWIESITTFCFCVFEGLPVICRFVGYS